MPREVNPVLLELADPNNADVPVAHRFIRMDGKAKQQVHRVFTELAPLRARGTGSQSDFLTACKVTANMRRYPEWWMATLLLFE